MKFFFLLLLAVIVFFFSCSDKPENTDGKITITFWHSFVSRTIPSFNNLVEWYEKENPNVKIVAQYVPSGDPLIQKLVTAIQSNTAPDISWLHSDFLHKLVEADAIYKMDHFINGTDGLSKEEMNDIFPQSLQSAKWRDTLYAMPMEATTLALIYNKNKFKEAGLDPEKPPKDWNELYDYAMKLTKDKDGDGKIDQYGFYIPAFPASGPLSVWMVLQWTPFLWQAGGEEINKGQTKDLYNNEAGVQALSFWKKIFEGEKFYNFTLTHDLGFVSGTVAMIMDGPWDLPEFRDIKNFDWGITYLPSGPVKRATYMAGEHLAIFKQSQHPGEAWKFIKWILRPDVQAKFSEESGYLPVRRSVLELPKYKKFLERDPAMKSFVDQIEISHARAPIDFFRVEINQNIAEAIEKVIIGNADVKSALDEAADKSNKLLQSINNKK
ncbi:MAG: ABC transporter substrate-binding protein [Ignavibacteria bacterium]|nr:ABC transporter substrate-binding protein [Ignavibacteria bacterium]